MTPHTPRSFPSILLMFLIGTGSPFATAAPDTAARNEAGTIEEVVVTARKISESLQEVPLTITAFSVKQLEERGIRDIRDLAAFTPGLTFTTPTDRSNGSIYLRGMSQVSGTGDTTRDIVSVFIDGVYYAGAAPSLTFDDLQRVEIVKGPQSAFFGRSTFGGAINFITRTPDNTARGALTARAGQFDDQGLSFSLEGPLLQDRLAARLAGSYSDYGGQYTNSLGGGQLGSQRQKFGSLSLAFTPTDNFSARLRVSYADQQDGAPAVQLLAQLPQHNCGPFGGINRGGPARLFCGEIKFSGTPALNPALPTAGRGKFGFDNLGLQRDYKTATLNADWKIGAGYTLSLLGGYQRENQEAVADFERTAADVWFSDALRQQKASSEELRFTSPQDQKLRWLVGLYNLKQDYLTGGNFMVGSANPLAVILPMFFPVGFATNFFPVKKVIENKAVFAAASFDVTNALKFSIEGRYQKDSLSTAQQAGGALAFDTKKFLPRFIADYRLNDHAKLYFNASRGDQPTTGNAQVTELSAASQVRAAGIGLFVVVPEATVSNYELGAKTSWNDGRVIANASVFYLQWKGKQGVRGFQIDINNDGLINTAATGAARENFNAQAYLAGDENIYGLDFETRALLTDQLQVGAAFALSHLSIKKLQDDLYSRYFGTLDASSQQEGLVPRASGTLFGQYSHSVGTESTGFVRADLTYIGKRYDSILNKAFVAATTKINLKAGVDYKGLNVTLYVDNLLDNRSVESASYQGDSALDPFGFLPASDETVLPRKRQIGVVASYKF